jgi:formylglycine-generating enzyme required for sulfatase activity
METRALQQPITTAAPATIRIPEGWFWMGSDHGLDCERPRHRVWVDAFELSPLQVTNRDYAEFLQATGSAEPPLFHHPDFSHPDQPVVAVSWFDAVAYCDWLKTTSGRPFRLPTEAEWERAARGGVEDKAYPWGDEAPQLRPGYADKWQRGPEPVGRSLPNAYGLYEMCENVHEWCSDWYDASYYLYSPERSPAGPDHGQRKSSRGGSWRHHVKNSKCYTRSSIPPEFQYADYGFRVAKDI